MTAITETTAEIPVRKVSRAEMMAELQAEIADYEQRYEMPSERMAALVEWGEMKETAEVLEWCFAYRALESLREQTPTAGSPGTTTEPSRTSV
ncbi:MAG: hypothetical protein F4X64_16770 [Chloroflexi bacterium]|nr:hypothetical protein [Chloroflexota bacterium]